MIWTVLQLIQWSEEFLRGKGVDSPRLDVDLLLARSLGLTRVQLYVQFDRPVAEKELADFKANLKRRASREPLAYILREKEFFSLNFSVGPEVLIPRPETEELAEKGLTHLQGFSSKDTPIRILDLATGSGCILISLVKHLPHAEGTGLDISDQALETAARNAAAHGVLNRTQWIRQDLALDWSPQAPGPWDLITANLPYVSQAEWADLQPEIREFEPTRALVPGEMGTEAFAWVLPVLSKNLAPRGLVLMEIGGGQGEFLKKFASRFFPADRIVIEKDLAGRDRFLRIKPSGEFAPA